MWVYLLVCVVLLCAGFFTHTYSVPPGGGTFFVTHVRNGWKAGKHAANDDDHVDDGDGRWCV